MKTKILITFLLLCSLSVFSQQIPKFEDWVTDNEKLFTPEQKASLIKMITDYRDSTSVEIAILTVPTFESSIDDFAQKTATEWKIGKKDVDNGLLIVLSKQKKVLRSQTGYGLEGYLPDGWLKLEGDSIVQKYFKGAISISTKSTKKDTSDIVNKVVNVGNTVLKSSKVWLESNGIIEGDTTKKITSITIAPIDSNNMYYEGTKAFLLACMNKIGKEYSLDHNTKLISANKKKEKDEEFFIVTLIRIVPWWGWVIIVVVWIIIFIFDPGLAINLLILLFTLGRAGGVSSGGGGKFGGGGSSSEW